MMTIIRTVRNWPRKIVSLHKTERKISDLHNLVLSFKNDLILSLKNENAEIRNSILELKSQLPLTVNEKIMWEKIYYKNIIQMGELLSITSNKRNIFGLIKKYFNNIDINDYQFLIDFAIDYQVGSFSSHHYSIEAFQKRIKQYADEFLVELNSAFLHPRELEITANHSMSRTFRFWSEDEKKTYIHFANHTIQMLKELSEYVCLGYGAVLASRRTGHLIPHDDDIDIIIYLPRSFHSGRMEAVEYVKNFLKRKGIRTASKDWQTHVQTYSPDGQLLDVFVAIEHNGLLDWIPGPEECFRFDTVFPARKIELEGILCDIPADADNYLCTLYGSEWQIPNHNFHHKWRTQG